MRSVAEWLVARPQNAVIALALTVSLGFLSFTSGIVLVVLVLHKGLQRALLDVALAGTLTVVIGLIAKVPLTTIVPGALAIWVPAMVLTAIMIRTGSLTLTVQLSVIFAIVAITGIYLIAGNPEDYWLDYLGQVIEELRRSSQFALADWVDQQRAYADQMTMVAVFANWSVHSVALVLGYRMFRLLPGQTARFGQFRDLNLGLVLALLTALASLLGMLTSLQWAQHVAFIAFGAFWLQGFAIVHWLYGEQMMPRIGLVAVYTLLLSLLLSAVTVIGLAIFGYLDAWFRLRRRPKTT